MNRVHMAEFRKIAPQVWDMFDLTPESRKSALEAASREPSKALEIYKSLIRESKVPDSSWKERNILYWIWPNAPMRGEPLAASPSRLGG